MRSWRCRLLISAGPRAGAAGARGAGGSILAAEPERCAACGRPRLPRLLTLPRLAEKCALSLSLDDQSRLPPRPAATLAAASPTAALAASAPPAFAAQDALPPEAAVEPAATPSRRPSDCAAGHTVATPMDSDPLLDLWTAADDAVSASLLPPGDAGGMTFDWPPSTAAMSVNDDAPRTPSDRAASLLECMTSLHEVAQLGAAELPTTEAGDASRGAEGSSGGVGGGGGGVGGGSGSSGEGGHGGRGGTARRDVVDVLSSAREDLQRAMSMMSTAGGSAARAAAALALTARCMCCCARGRAGGPAGGGAGDSSQCARVDAAPQLPQHARRHPHHPSGCVCGLRWARAGCWADSPADADYDLPFAAQACVACVQGESSGRRARRP